MLFKKKIQREDDRVWPTTELKWNGIVEEILSVSGNYLLVLAVVENGGSGLAITQFKTARGNKD